jgi:hypothetical protein
VNPPDNNPHNPRPGLFVLKLCFFRDFGSYLFSYEQGVELLYNEVASGKQTAEAVGPPLVFLMRQSLELGYKFTVSELYRLSGSDYGPYALNKSLNKFKHSLSGWHGELKDAYEKVAERFSLSDDERDDFAKHYERTQLGMQEFERLDMGSFNFRFPTDMKGKLIWSHEATVDLLALKNQFDESMILLRHTVDVLSPCWETFESAE